MWLYDCGPYACIRVLIESKGNCSQFSTRIPAQPQKRELTAVTVDSTLLAPDAIVVRYAFAQCFAFSEVGVKVLGTAAFESLRPP